MLHKKVDLQTFRVAIDSGAFGMFKDKFKPSKDKTSGNGLLALKYFDNADYTYLDTQEFKTYLEKYIAYLHANKNHLHFYFTLDVIGDAQRSWDLTKYMESCGLSPLPVYHVGEPFDVLKKLIDNYEYIGLGGLASRNKSLKSSLPLGDKIFDLICDKQGRPRRKYHGLAVTSPMLVMMYPWHTCDASTWTYLARCGTVYVPMPILKQNQIIGWDYTKQPLTLPTTERRKYDKKHVEFQPPTHVKALEAFLEENGIEMEEIKTSYHARDVLNMRYFKKLSLVARQQIAEKFNYEDGGTIYLAGTPSGASTNLTRLVNLVNDVELPELHWLACFSYKKHADNVIKIREQFEVGKPLSELQTEPANGYRQKINGDTVEIKDTYSIFNPAPTTTPRIKRVQLSRPLEQNRLQIKPRAVQPVKEDPPQPTESTTEPETPVWSKPGYKEGWDAAFLVMGTSLDNTMRIPNISPLDAVNALQDCIKYYQTKKAYLSK